MEPNRIVDTKTAQQTHSRNPLKGRASQHHHGYHLTSEGLYRDSVTAMCVRNPNLRWSHGEYINTPSEYGKATVLELRAPYPALAARLNFKSSVELSKYLKSKSVPSMRRIVLLEGLSKNHVEVLGSHFNMDPAFFANQKRPNSWDVIKPRGFIERTANLPSLNDPKRSFMIRYPELRHFPPNGGRTQLDAPHVNDLDGHRQVFIGRRAAEQQLNRVLIEGGFHNIGIFNRAASYWSRRYEGGGWDAIVLLDPPSNRIIKTNHKGEVIPGQELNHRLLHGGYQDFIPYPVGLDDSREFVKKAANGPSRVSILEDICFYFVNHPETLEAAGDDPMVATIFMKKIAATNWMHLADYFNACAHNLEYQFSKNDSFDVFRVETMERWWGDIHSWHRRCVQYCEEANAILLVLRIPPEYVPGTGDDFNLMDSREDFAYIYKRLLWTKSRFELLMNSATGLNAIAGNKEATAQNERYSRRAREESKRSLQQARKGSILTFLATVFVPLAATAGIFSMSGEWAPGGEKFGYYWAVTLPLVFLLGAFYWLFGLVLKRSKHGDEEDLGG